MQEIQPDGTDGLQKLDGQQVQVEQGKLENRGESPKELRWKYAEIVIEWGFQPGSEHRAFSGNVESTHLLGEIGAVTPLPGDTATRMAGERAWMSPASDGCRRGVVVSVLHTDAERGLGRTIVTVRTESGSFSFLPLDLGDGPILVPELGFFVAEASADITGSAYAAELGSQNRKTVREMVRERPEKTWEDAMRGIHGDIEFPPFPEPPYEPRMSVEVPDDHLTALWRIGAWQIVKNCPRIRREDIREVGRMGDVGELPRVEDPADPQGVYVVRDNPFPPLATETDRILWALDHLGMHDVARDGISIWMENQDHDGALRLNSDIERAHSVGEVQLLWVIAEHARLTGDREWLEREKPRLRAAFDWLINRRRSTMKENLSEEELEGIKAGTWSPYGLQPKVSMGDGNPGGTRYYYWADAFGYQSAKLIADVIADLDAELGSPMLAEVEAYREDILPVLSESIVLSPVMKVLDGTYRSFMPQGFQDRGPLSRALPEGVDVYTHCGPYHADYCITGAAIEAWLRSGLLSIDDSWLDGHFDVIEDVLVWDHPWFRRRKEDYDPETDWFTFGGWAYQSGWERMPDYYLVKDDIPNFLRSWLIRFAVDVNLSNWTFNEHTTMAENDKSHGNGVFLSNFRNMLVMELDDSLWLGRGTPRAWLEQGKRISVHDAPTHFGDVGYEVVSEVDNGAITATIDLPSRREPEAVYVRFRHPESAPIKSVTVNGQTWSAFDGEEEAVELRGLTGKTTVVANY